MNAQIENPLIDISDYGVLLAKGPDAKKFLQGQVTCDIDALSFSEGENQSNLGAHCTHKGRMLFSFRALQVGEDTIALSMPKEVIPHALECLKKYSVFSKVELSDASDDYRILGITDITALGDSNIKAYFPNPPETLGYATHHKGLHLIRVSEKRYECWINKEEVSTVEALLTTSDQNLWHALNIADGIGEIRTETIEEFIPQMLNYQLIGNGISFKKGCYTGQEVVARMHYLGKLKKHMYRFSSTQTQPIAPGAPLFSPDSKQAIGHVVISAKVDDGQELLAVVTEQALNDDKVYAEEDCQHKLDALMLPYAITNE